MDRPATLAYMDGSIAAWSPVLGAMVVSRDSSTYRLTSIPDRVFVPSGAMVGPPSDPLVSQLFDKDVYTRTATEITSKEWDNVFQLLATFCPCGLIGLVCNQVIGGKCGKSVVCMVCLTSFLMTIKSTY